MTVLDIARIVFALLAVLAMIAICTLIARRLATTSHSLLVRTRKRVQLVETIGLDAKRRLAIIRCDDREHLIVFGPHGETVLDRDIPKIPDPLTAEGSDKTPALNPFAALLSRTLTDARTLPGDRANKAA